MPRPLLFFLLLPLFPTKHLLLCLFSFHLPLLPIHRTFSFIFSLIYFTKICLIPCLLFFEALFYTLFEAHLSMPSSRAFSNAPPLSPTVYSSAFFRLYWFPFPFPSTTFCPYFTLSLLLFFTGFLRLSFPFSTRFPPSSPFLLFTTLSTLTLSLNSRLIYFVDLQDTGKSCLSNCSRPLCSFPKPFVRHSLPPHRHQRCVRCVCNHTRQQHRAMRTDQHPMTRRDGSTIGRTRASPGGRNRRFQSVGSMRCRSGD